MLLGKSHLEQNLRELPRWAAGFHVPDVNYFADVVRFRHIFLEHLVSRLERGGVEPLSLFPYRKPSGGRREFVLLTAGDLVLGRALAGEVAARVEELLPPAVFSNRLAKPPPRWRFRPTRRAYKDMQEVAKDLLYRHGGMSKGDVKNYYPNIEVSTLRLSLLAYGCDASVVKRICELLEGWQTQGCSGIPVGGDAFGVLGNAYLLPLDVRLSSHGTPYVRWVDDVFWFGRDLPDRLGSLEVVDQELSILSLELGPSKTIHFEGFSDALAEIEDGMLTSLFEGGLRKRPRQFQDRVRNRFMEHIVEADEIEPRRFRALVRTMQNRRDAFAVPFLVFDPRLLDIDPAVAGDYLSEIIPTRAQGEVLVHLLSETAVEDRDLYDARDLHLLRALSTRVWGTEEGRVFWEIAMDDTRRGPVRAWAVLAAARTPAWVGASVVERVLEEIEPSIRRALVLSLYREHDHPRLKGFFRHVRRFAPELIPPVEWVESNRKPVRMRV